MTTLDSNLDPFGEGLVGHLAKSHFAIHDERLQAIFRKFPNFKAAVDAGTMRVWVDEDGEHYDVVGDHHEIAGNRSHVSKHFGHVQISDDQHEEIERRAKELQDLIAEHPYIKTAIDDGWAKVCIAEDGTLALEFVHGARLHLHCFDDETVDKSSKFDEAMGKVSKASSAVQLPGYTKAEIDARVRAAIRRALPDLPIPNDAALCGSIGF